MTDNSYRQHRYSLLRALPGTHFDTYADYDTLCCANSPLFALYQNDKKWWHDFTRTCLRNMESDDFDDFTEVTDLRAISDYSQLSPAAWFFNHDIYCEAVLSLCYTKGIEGIEAAEDEYPWEFLDPTAMMIQAARAMYDKDFIMISIDLEFYGHDTDFITEIGISVMSSEGCGEHCSECGASRGPRYMVPDIETYHIVTAEHSNSTKNGDYVPDHRGLSTNAVSAKLVRKHRGDYFDYIIKRCQDDAEMRGDLPIYYVGHCVKSDLEALVRDGYSVPQYPVLDTATIWTYPLTKDSISLQNIALELGLQQRFLHNAANGALLALNAVVRMCDPEFRRLNSMPQPMAIVRLAPQIMKRQEKLRKRCASKGLEMTRYQPPVLKKVAERRGKPDVYVSHEYMRNKMSTPTNIAVEPYFVEMLSENFI